jgi:hypothetical protein
VALLVRTLSDLLAIPVMPVIPYRKHDLSVGAPLWSQKTRNKKAFHIADGVSDFLQTP